MKLLPMMAVALAMSGCTTRIIVDHDIAVPASLTGAEVELAIKEALEGTRSRLPGIPNNEYRSGAARAWTQGHWSLEDPAPGFLKAVLRVDQYGRVPHGIHHRVLKVGIWHSESGVRTRIIGASQLKYDGKRVHKTALAWHDRLDDRIRSELAWAADSKIKRRG